MSVKRYDFDCYAFYDSARLSVNECEDGDYVLHSEYAALLARHNALREAVEWERKAHSAYNDACAEDGYGQLVWATENLTKARAEVDRLLNDAGECPLPDAEVEG